MNLAYAISIEQTVPRARLVAQRLQVLFEVGRQEAAFAPQPTFETALRILREVVD